ncbi:MULTISPECIES: YeeE/YedE family protein [unclassified Aureispira]|uniref:YeeE/YedE family protein n=1 Tax=unclassified Aureispira TaxID=2649989 RepID=UPI00069638D9|nr:MULTISPECIES: YeeE/YedE thiosulfate transporter family protein [unclassified Aureispira]WMX16356.1 YeeE/YedE thiosulfate transporter family protein [Aureispira sp. CCB-E]
MLELIQQPWHWAFSGFMIAFTMFILLFWGKSFGMSATMRAMCAAGGAGKKISFFDFEWKKQGWNLLFALGAVIGGYIASNYLTSPEPVQISSATIAHLQGWGINYPSTIAEGTGYLPLDLFNFETLLTLKGLLLFVGGGFFVGFGARYAGGCTSGHAISGLSNLQVPSLIAVIGFFIGGLLMTHILLPLILKL